MLARVVARRRGAAALVLAELGQGLVVGAAGAGEAGPGAVRCDDDVHLLAGPFRERLVGGAVAVEWHTGLDEGAHCSLELAHGGDVFGSEPHQLSLAADAPHRCSLLEHLFDSLPALVADRSLGRARGVRQPAHHVELRPGSLRVLLPREASIRVALLDTVGSDPIVRDSTAVGVILLSGGSQSLRRPQWLGGTAEHGGCTCRGLACRSRLAAQGGNERGGYANGKGGGLGAVRG